MLVLQATNAGARRPGYKANVKQEKVVPKVERGCGKCGTSSHYGLAVDIST